MKKTLFIFVFILVAAFPCFAAETQIAPEILKFLHNNPTGHMIQAADLLKEVARGEKVHFIDVRNPEEFAKKHVYGAINIPYDNLAENLDKIPREGRVVVYCHTGRRGEGAMTVLQLLGYDNVVNLGGGITALSSAITLRDFPLIEFNGAAPVNHGPAADDEDAEPDMGC